MERQTRGHLNSLALAKHECNSPCANNHKNTVFQVDKTAATPWSIAQTQQSGISSEELELHIRDCGRHIERCMADYAESHNLSDRGEADFWRLRMEEAIRSRTPPQEQQHTGGR